MSSSRPVNAPRVWSLRLRLLVGQVVVLAVVCIGITAATELASHITDPAMQAALRDMMNSMRALQPEDIANAVLYAVSQPEHVAVTKS